MVPGVICPLSDRGTFRSWGDKSPTLHGFPDFFGQACMLKLRKHRWTFIRNRPGRRGKSGSVALEFAILFVPFFFLLMGTVELMIFFVVSGSLDDATVVAARNIRTDQPGMRSDVSVVRTTICDSLVPFTNCNNIFVSGERYGSFSEAEPFDPINNRVFNPASLEYEPNFNNDIYLLTVYYDLQFFTPFIGQFFSNVEGNRRLMVSSFAFRNEP